MTKNKPNTYITPDAERGTTPKAPTKPKLIISLLRQAGGAPMEDLITATNWKRHTVRAALTGLRKQGHVIVTHKSSARTIYQLNARDPDGRAEDEHLRGLSGKHLRALSRFAASLCGDQGRRAPALELTTPHLTAATA